MKLRILCWRMKKLRQQFWRKELLITLNPKPCGHACRKIEPCFLIHAITSFLCCANS